MQNTNGRNSRTYTRSYNSSRRNFTDERRAYRNNLDRSSNSFERGNSRKRYISKVQRSDEKVNIFALKAIVSILAVAIVFITVNTVDSAEKLRSDIKSAISENISENSVDGILSKVESLFNKKNDTIQSEYSDFRIDENIIEQMNNEQDEYFNK